MNVMQKFSGSDPHAITPGCAESVIVVNKGNDDKMANKSSDNVTLAGLEL